MNHPDENIYNVMKFGASGDGRTIETSFIQRAIDSCSGNGGGVVYFPSGTRFLTGTIYLESNVTLFVAENAVILGSRDLEDYSDDTGICPYHPEPLDRCLIYAKDKKNICFEGNGIIDGQFREDFLDKHDNPLGTDSIQRPMLIRLENCSDIKMKDLTVKGAYSWCVHIKYCENIKLTGLTVLNDRQDGFNIESSKTITISDCHLHCGDDGIALTTSAENKPLTDLTVSNCIISSRWAAIRLGPLSKGNFENIVVSNCVLKNCGGGGIKIGMFEGATIKNCLFSSIIMDNVTSPVLIMNAVWTDIGSQDKNPPMMAAGVIKDIMFSDMIIHASAGPVQPWDLHQYTDEEINDFLLRPDRNSTIFLHGHKNGKLENLTFCNLKIDYPGGGIAESSPFEDLVDMHEIDIHSHGYWTDDKTIWGIPIASAFYARHVRSIDLSDVAISFRVPEQRPGIAISDSESVDMDRIRINRQKMKSTDLVQQNSSEITIN
ncbi:MULTISPECIES: glycoside hydrolase family 28 protein [unclassified Oceanispirochaeta]|uniref:glycoside hydrolase family 28 protein n=1 Tax=unclassified Oceanispirochaeta TaxID=2635722 RepID=UPI000E08CEB4|nr:MULTISPECIES: glycosyl hydrolase family 28-related protein [unclassified Oceanispirochaeta]MBF9014256.1 right-handed parallel beta-helix repeat-containing protein [Oceanispirochaeta sp. M2]NPD71142.1 hypothetical protein [Oceanispirochaeta sp. M1]RDG33536.1 hypothetical protein DV872_03425 [Oceanispirochaeta sp. M1]